MHLGKVPHKRLTKPAKVFDFHFQGARKPLGRDTMVRLDTVTHGTLNAVVFWFDVHLDEQCSLTSGEALAQLLASWTGTTDSCYTVRLDSSNGSLSARWCSGATCTCTSSAA